MESVKTEIKVPDRVWFSVSETAEILGMSEETTRRLCRLGKIEARRFGRQYRVPRSVLVAEG